MLWNREGVQRTTAELGKGSLLCHSYLASMVLAVLLLMVLLMVVMVPMGMMARRGVPRGMVP